MLLLHLSLLIFLFDVVVVCYGIINLYIIIE